MKKLNVKRSTMFALLLSLGVSSMMLIAFTKIGYAQIDPWLRNQKFDSENWINVPKKRYRMINDIVASENLIGKSKEEIIQLFGHEYNDNQCLNCIAFSYIDPDYFFGIDHPVIVFQFDEQKRVSNVTRDDW